MRRHTSRRDLFIVEASAAYHPALSSETPQLNRQEQENNALFLERATCAPQINEKGEKWSVSQPDFMGARAYTTALSLDLERIAS
jgi:hypothetical protein